MLSAIDVQSDLSHGRPSGNIVAQLWEEKKDCEEKKATTCRPEALLLREGFFRDISDLAAAGMAFHQKFRAVAEEPRRCISIASIAADPSPKEGIDWMNKDGSRRRVDSKCDFRVNGEFPRIWMPRWPSAICGNCWYIATSWCECVRALTASCSTSPLNQGLQKKHKLWSRDGRKLLEGLSSHSVAKKADALSERPASQHQL
jgi:hypothetical protein